MKRKARSTLRKIVSVSAGVLLVVLLALPYLLFRDAIQQVQTMGYLGLLISCALSNAAIFLPTSSTIIVLAAATTLNPWLCILFGGVGGALGEQVSYLCGRIGRQGFVRDSDQSQPKVIQWLHHNAFLTVFLFALIPLPVFDLVGIAAGAMKLSWPQYACAAALGKVTRLFLLIFLIGFFLPEWVEWLPAETAENIRLLLPQINFSG